MWILAALLKCMTLTFQILPFLNAKTAFHRTDGHTRYFIEDQELTTPHYKDNFFEPNGSVIPHYNFVGHIQLPFYPSGEPVIISVVNKDGQLFGLCAYCK